MKLDIDLPEVLIAFKKNIEASIKPFIEIKASQEENLLLWQSKFGGLPYFPKDLEYPKDAKGQPMFLLAQINFAESPKLEKFPKAGILQFYISGGDDLYGAILEDLGKQDGFRVLYFPEVFEDESKLITDFGFLPEPDMLPFGKSCSLKFSLKHAPVTANDYQFESLVIGQGADSGPDIDKVYSEYETTFPAYGHRIGGYPYFTQSDPRNDEKYKNQQYVLLFQMDSDEEAGILWGDVGVGNFFITEQDLQKKDFSRVLYSWDCG
ncbi:MAG: DUF1963 domain-containing protein [Chloroflexi bacterium HGW-Chloroflexi-6]|nr:MAG: DUF1963 domain-containing protein [Chloroflexi bacterium HGW-Chloroflexi-6]